MSSFIVIAADKSDHYRLSEIAVESKRHWGYPEEWINEWKEELTISSDYIRANKVFNLIDNKDASICGFCALELNLEKKVVEIAHLWILSSYIGQNLGKHLLQSSLDNISDYNIKLAKVTSDPNALGFYRNFGFVEVGYTESTPIGRVLPNLEMELV